MRKIENHYLANIPLQNYESISLAIWSKKVQILTTKSGSVSQSSSSASFTIAFGSYPAFHIFLKQKEGKYFDERTLKAIKGNRVTSWPTPLNRSRDVLFIQPLVIHEFVSIVFLKKSECGNFDYSFSRNFKSSLGKERISQRGWTVETLLVFQTQGRTRICLLVENMRYSNVST